MKAVQQAFFLFYPSGRAVARVLVPGGFMHPKLIVADFAEYSKTNKPSPARLIFHAHTPRRSLRKHFWSPLAGGAEAPDPSRRMDGVQEQGVRRQRMARGASEAAVFF